MANNKVQLSNGTVVIDLTSDTVTSASHIKSGLVGHLADGTTATGTLIEKDVKSVTYNLSGGATASISTSEVVTNQGFSVKLNAPTRCALTGVTVIMGGVDITDQVFEYDEGGGAPSLQTKTVSYTPTTSSQSAQVTADSGYDGLEQVNVSVGAIPSEYIVPAGTKSITENGTDIDVAQYASVDVAVPSSSGTKTATGKYTPTETYSTTSNRLICSITDIGFTPSRFILELDDRANTEVTQYAVLRSSYEEIGDTKSPFRTTGRWSNSSGGTSAACSLSSWTSQTNYFLYKNSSGSIYFRTTSAYILPAGVTYKWTAYE